jgi:hypothetical protein
VQGFRGNIGLEGASSQTCGNCGVRQILFFQCSTLKRGRNEWRPRAGQKNGALNTTTKRPSDSHPTLQPSSLRVPSSPSSLSPRSNPSTITASMPTRYETNTARQYAVTLLHPQPTIPTIALVHSLACGDEEPRSATIQVGRSCALEGRERE